MKKALIYSLSLALILSLAACGQQEPQQENTPPDPAVTSTQPDISTPEPPADPEPELDKTPEPVPAPVPEPVSAPNPEPAPEPEPEPEPPATPAPEPVVDTPSEAPAKPEQTTDIENTSEKNDEPSEPVNSEQQANPDGEHDTDNPDFNPQTLETLPKPTEEELRAEEQASRDRLDKLLRETDKNLEGAKGKMNLDTAKKNDDGSYQEQGGV